MLKRSLIHGLSAGAIMVGLFMISNALGVQKLGYSKAELAGFATILLGLSTIFFAIRNHRDKDLGGSISFWNAFKAGAIVSLLAALITTVFIIILHQTTDATQQLADMYQQQLVSNGMTAEAAQAQFDAEMAAAPDWAKGPLGQGVIMFLTILPIGLIVTAVSGLILRKK